MSTPLVIETRGLTKRFGAHVAVDDVDLHVAAGARYGFLGPNGSGKTTMVRMLLGLVYATRGEITVLGRPVPSRVAEVLPEIGAMVEGPAAYPHLSGRANLALLDAAGPRRRSTGQGRRRRVEEVLERVGLGAIDRRPVKAYSLGMRQRLGLAGALLDRPRLLVLDEPTNGLDPAGTRDVRRVVADLGDAGATVLLSSHLLAEVEAVCTHVAVLQTGTLLVSGELRALLDADAGGLVVSTPDVDDAILALREAGVPSYRADGGVAVPPGSLEAPEIVAALVGAGVAVWEVHRRRAHLEELFARLTEEDA